MKLTDKLLFLGNPPWVTNSALGSIASTNLPPKTNIKRHKGLDALTGKGNLDIAEAIAYELLTTFAQANGHFAFLVKNIVHHQAMSQLPIGYLEQHTIHIQREFNAAVAASLFCYQLNATPTLTCTAFDFYTQEKQRTFGWEGSKFVLPISAPTSSTKS